MAKKPVKFSVVDAFTESAFIGNPAAVCFLEEDRDDQWLQALATEFNLSETCYLTRLRDSVANPSSLSAPDRFILRWFSPTKEVDLCGHATLAAASTLFNSGLVTSKIIEFSTLSGTLTAKKVPDDVKVACSGSTIPNSEAKDSYFIELNFPADPPNEFKFADASLISNALGGASVTDIRRTTVTDDLLVVLPSAKAVVDIQPQYDEIRKCPGTRGVIVTAVAPPESGYDFYSRFFCPKNGIGEASPRGGTLNIHLDEQNQRVLLRGKAVTPF